MCKLYDLDEYIALRCGKEGMESEEFWEGYDEFMMEHVDRKSINEEEPHNKKG